MRSPTCPGIRVGQAQRTGEGWLTGTTVVLPPAEGAVGGRRRARRRPGHPGDRPARPAQPGRAGARDRAHRRVGAGAGRGRRGGAGRCWSRASASRSAPSRATWCRSCRPRWSSTSAAAGSSATPPDAALGREALRRRRRRGRRGHRRRRHRRPRRRAQGRGRVRPRPGWPTAPPSAPWWCSTPSARPSTPRPGSCTPRATAAADDLPGLRRPDAGDLEAARQRAAEQPEPRPPLATTLAVIATDATLTKAQCQKVSGIGHDGLARAINPVHTMYDGDTVFTLATGAAAAPDPAGLPRAAHRGLRLRDPGGRPRTGRGQLGRRDALLPGGVPLRVRLTGGLRRRAAGPPAG